jgi:hypothetical protein
MFHVAKQQTSYFQTILNGNPANKGTRRNDFNDAALRLRNIEILASDNHLGRQGEPLTPERSWPGFIGTGGR